jgi:hypothetical protein
MESLDALLYSCLALDNQVGELLFTNSETAAFACTYIRDSSMVVVVMMMVMMRGWW